MSLQVLDPQAALAMERGLFEAAGGRWVAWTTQRCLVVPRSLVRRPGFDAACTTLADDGWPVVVRSSGGDVVPLGPGVVCVSVAVPRTSPDVQRISSGYAWLCAPVIAHLEALGEPATLGWVAGSFCDGAHNLVVRGRKLAGTAQRRGREAVLLHLALTVNADLEASVAAVNRFAEGLGSVVRVREEAHINLAEVVGLARAHDWLGSLPEWRR